MFTGCIFLGTREGSQGQSVLELLRRSERAFTQLHAHEELCDVLYTQAHLCRLMGWRYGHSSCHFVRLSISNHLPIQEGE